MTILHASGYSDIFRVRPSATVQATHSILEFLSVSIVQLSKFPLVNCKSAEKLEFQLSGGAAARYIWRTTSSPLHDFVTSARLRHLCRTSSPLPDFVTFARLRHLCTTSSPVPDFVTSARLRHLCTTSSPLPDFVTFAGLLHRCPTSSPLHDFFTAAEHRPR